MWRKIISNSWSHFFIAAALVLSGAATGDFRYSLEPAVIQPGERATLTLRLPESDLVRPEGQTEELLPEAGDEFLFTTPGLELLDQEYRKENGEFIWRYQFTSYTLGDLVVPPISVKLGPQAFSSERLTLKVKTDRAPEDMLMRPDSGAISLPFNWSFWLSVLFLMATGAAAYFTRHLWWKPKTVPEAIEPAQPDEPPLEWLRRQLLVLRARLDVAPDDEKSPDAWSSILREFGAKQSHAPVTAWTTGELARRFSGDEKWKQIVGIMQECDRYRFANRVHENPGKKTLGWIEESEKTLL